MNALVVRKTPPRNDTGSQLYQTGQPSSTPPKSNDTALTVSDKSSTGSPLIPQQAAHLSGAELTGNFPRSLQPMVLEYRLHVLEVTGRLGRGSAFQESGIAGEAAPIGTTAKSPDFVAIPSAELDALRRDANRWRAFQAEAAEESANHDYLKRLSLPSPDLAGAKPGSWAWDYRTTEIGNALRVSGIGKEAAIIQRDEAKDQENLSSSDANPQGDSGKSAGGRLNKQEGPLWNLSDFLKALAGQRPIDRPDVEDPRRRPTNPVSALPQHELRRDNSDEARATNTAPPSKSAGEAEVAEENRKRAQRRQDED